MNKRIFAWSGVMMLLAAIFVWGMTGHPKAAGENSDRKAQAVSGAGVSGGAVSGAAVSPSAVTGSSLTPAPIPTPVVNLENSKYVKLNAGEIVGVQGKKAFRYMGIPYGAAKRWSAPTAVSSWQGIKKCTKARKAKGDDALFLNVYRPKNLSSSGHGISAWRWKRRGNAEYELFYICRRNGRDRCFG